MSSIDAGASVPTYAHAPSRPPTPLRTQVAWGAAGFLLGAIAWHFVGFWTFVSTIVFRGPAPSAAVSAETTAQLPARSASVPTKRMHTVRGTVPVKTVEPAADPDIGGIDPTRHCSSLVLDRSTRTTSLVDCAGADLTMQVVYSGGRVDRQPTPFGRDAGWSVTVDAQTAASD